MPLPTCSVSLPVSERPLSADLIRSAERDSDGFLKLESLDFFETPTPTESGRKKHILKSRGKKRQKAATNLPQFVAMAREILPPLAAFCHRQLPEFAAVCRRRGAISSHFNFQLLATTVFRR